MALDLTRDTHLALLLLLDAGLPLAELLHELVHGQIDCGVEVVLGVLGVEILARHRQMDLRLVVLLLGTVLVEQKHDMGCQNLVGVLLQMGDLIGNVGVDGGGKRQMTGAEVDLHRFVSLIPFYGRTKRRATKMRGTSGVPEKTYP